MDIQGFNDTIEWYNQNAETYAKAQSGGGFQVKAHLDAFAAALPEAGSVLDAGCAAGRDSISLHQLGFSVTGLDLSQGLLNEAKKLYPDINFVHGNFLNLSFEDASFDGIWANSSLLHFETVDEVRKALLEFHRVLKKDGVLHVVVKAQTSSDKTQIISDSLSNHKRFFQYFKDEELRDLVIEAGFEIEHLEHYQEVDRIPHGRPEVELIWILATQA